MLINFLHPIFNPELTCDKISDDIYDLSNLISSSKSKREMGWQAYSSNFEIIYCNLFGVLNIDNFSSKTTSNVED